METKGEILLYEDAQKGLEIQVRLENETLWLSQKMMATLFEKDSDTIGLHLKNIFKEGELDENSTTEFFSVVQNEGKRQMRRDVKFYNLDAILSVGYRVNSKRGTQFRQWATQRLRDFLVKGYAVNQKRLAELQQVVQFIQQSGQQSLTATETKGFLELLSSYTQSFVLLNQYDTHRLAQPNRPSNTTSEIEYAEAKKAIDALKRQLIIQKEATQLFGNEKDSSFEGTLQSIVQTFGGEYLYPTIEAQAAHLLYFVIKNHPFSDGNKRIGAFLFVWFLEKNKHRYKPNGEIKINDNGLVALALLVAQSDPNDKELMIHLICNLIL
jgi:prophage maintenance system killer protein